MAQPQDEVTRLQGLRDTHMNALTAIVESAETAAAAHIVPLMNIANVMKRFRWNTSTGRGCYEDEVTSPGSSVGGALLLVCDGQKIESDLKSLMDRLQKAFVPPTPPLSANPGDLT
jgi:hypothetical protein